MKTRTIRFYQVLLILLLSSNSYSQEKDRGIGILDKGNPSMVLKTASKTSISEEEKENIRNDNTIAFNEDGSLLYLKNSKEGYLQIWNTEKKVKIQEANLSELEKSRVGRTILACFTKSITFANGQHDKTNVWVSADYRVTIEDERDVAIYDTLNKKIQEIKLPKYKGDKCSLDWYPYRNYYKTNEVGNTYAGIIRMHCYKNKLFIVVGYYFTKKKSDYCSDNLYVIDLADFKFSTLNEYVYNQFKNREFGYFFGSYYTRARVSEYDDSYVHTVVSLDSINNVTLYWGTHQNFRSFKFPATYLGINKALNKYFEIDDYYPLYSTYCKTIPTVLTASGEYISEFQQNREYLNLNFGSVINPAMAVTMSNDGSKLALLPIYQTEELGYYASLNIINTASPAFDWYSFTDVEKYEPFIKEYTYEEYKVQVGILQSKINKVDADIAAIYKKEGELYDQKKYGELLIGKKWKFTRDFPRSFADADHKSNPFITNLSIAIDLEFKANPAGGYYAISNTTFYVPSTTINFDVEWFHYKERSSQYSEIKYYMPLSFSNKFMFDQSFVLNESPLGAAPFGDNAKWINAVRNEFVTANDYFLLKRSFQLYQPTTASGASLYLYESDGKEGDFFKAEETAYHKSLLKIKADIVNKMSLLKYKK